MVPVYFLLRMVWAAFVFPMELEVREGINWLYVLARKAGMSIYDHSQVAYFGSHGPVDHLLKALVSEILPFLSSQSVVRFFCLLLPFCLFFMTLQAFHGLGRGRWSLALAGMALIEIGMCNLQNYHLLVGRTDPTALCLLALQAGLTARVVHRHQLRWHFIIGYGFLVAVEVFTIWRFLPTVAALGLITVLFADGRFFRNLLKLATPVCAFTFSIFLILLFWLFAGDFEKFYQHFVGIFIDAQYVPLVKEGAFDLFPEEILQIPTYVGILLLPMVILAIFLWFRKDQTRVQRVILFSLAVACYALHVFGYNKNKVGGGLYYLSPYLLFLWFLIFLAVPRFQKALPRFLLIVGLLLFTALGPSWSQTQRQTDNLESYQQTAADFRGQLQKGYTTGSLMSEDLQLFKDQVGASIVDNGDGVEELSRLKYFDADFRVTGQRFFDLVKASQFEYYIVGGVASPSTMEFLKAHYDLVAKGPDYDSWSGPGGCVVVTNCNLVFRRRK